MHFNNKAILEQANLGNYEVFLSFCTDDTELLQYYNISFKITAYAGMTIGSRMASNLSTSDQSESSRIKPLGCLLKQQVQFRAGLFCYLPLRQ